jgi:hypothetical protein
MNLSVTRLPNYNLPFAVPRDTVRHLRVHVRRQLL